MNKLKLFSIIAFALFLALSGLTGTTPANAGIYGGLTEERCMADAYLLEPGNSLPKDALGCTANDVEITQVVPVDPNQECTLGEVFSFQADVSVRTNANERWDTTFYLPLTNQSPQDVQIDLGLPNPTYPYYCSLVVPIPDNEPGQIADVDLDGDACGDITKALGPDEYTLSDETITMLCTPSPEDPTKALFTYCAAWDNQERDNCTIDRDPYPGQIPNTKSKCKCDSFPINVFIRPEPPEITKTLVGTNTRPEAGGEYTFNISFTNESPTASIFLSGLSDEVDEGQNGYETSLDLWGQLDVVGPDTPDGVYLTASNCEVGDPLVEVLPSDTYSCQITVHIVDTDLPDLPVVDPSKELYDDVIVAVLEDKNGDPLGTGSTCPADLAGTGAGDNCSDELTVEVTNVAPSITVTKTPSVDQVLEDGADVTFTIVVTSTSGSYDDPLTITSLTDTDFTNLGTCATGGSLFVGSPYTCSFTAFIGGNAGDVHSNTVTAKAVDNENDEAQASDSATVNINDVPSSINLVKTADPEQVLETGDDPTVFRAVDYTFEFSVDTEILVDGELVPVVDDVTFDELVDDVEGVLTDLTSQCVVDGTPLANGITLAPGGSASCVITLQLQGNADDVRVNTATIYGTDEDGVDLMASDDATVTFLNAELDIAQEFAMKATAFVRITNNGVDTATITSFTIGGVNLVASGGIPGQFEILDEAASSIYETGDGPYAFCATGASIAPQGRYDCSFTLKLFPGFEAGNIDFLATGVNGLVVTLEDDDGSSFTTDVDITIQTQE